MDFALTDELLLLQQTIRAFVDDEIRPRAEDIDRSNTFPPEL